VGLLEKRRRTAGAQKEGGSTAKGKVQIRLLLLDRGGKATQVFKRGERRSREEKELQLHQEQSGTGARNDSADKGRKAFRTAFEMVPKSTQRYR